MLVSGANTIVINVISGSGGDGFLWVFCELGNFSIKVADWV